MDSMLSLWYVKNSILNNNINSTNDTVVVPYYSDEMYVERLSHMNTYIEMTYNDIVKKYIEFYSLKRRRQVEVMLGLSEYYFPIFEQALDKYGLPLELKFLPVIESALNPSAISRARASGLWQFMYTTGKLYNLNVTTFIDERQNPVKSSEAAAHYLRDLYDIYHDWQLVIAAYNCGPGNINKAIKRSGKTTYWGIYDKLPRETRGYVPAYIAAAFTLTNYKELKLIPRKIELPKATDTVMVYKELHLGQVSEVLKIPFEKLKALNPQYKKDIIPGYDTLPLMLPAETITQFIILKDSIFNYKDSIYFSSIHPSMYLNSNSKGLSSGTKRITYTVKSGDTFSSVAKKYKITSEEIKLWNDIRKNRLTVGKKLTLYVSEEIVNSKKQSAVKNTEVVNKEQNLDVKKGEYIYYTVKSGDNLYSISKKYNNVTADQILKLNNITNPRSLKVGQKLKIKTKE